MPSCRKGRMKMGDLLRRYYRRLRKYRIVYAAVTLVTIVAVFLVLSVYSAGNASFNKSLNLDDPKVNPQNYARVSKAFFAGYAIYSDVKDAQGKPLVEGYQFQSRELAIPMHKEMVIYFSGQKVREELLALADMTDVSYKDIEIHISDYSSMCYRFNVFSQDKKLSKSVGEALDQNIAKILERDLGITYVRTIGNISTSTGQSRPLYYLSYVNDAKSQRLAAAAMDEWPVNMKKTVYGRTFCLAAALGAGFLLFFLLLIVSEYFSNKIHRAEQIQAITKHPYLASIPLRGSEKTYTALAKTIQEMNGFGTCMAAVGCMPKSRVFPAVSGLAKRLAAEGKRVLIVNLSDQPKGLDTRLKLKKKQGVSDVLDGAIEIQNVGERLDAVPMGGDSEKIQAACESDAFKAFIEKARETYDYVLFYSADVVENPSILSVLERMDCALVLVEYSAVSKSRLTLTLERLDLFGVEKQALLMLDAAL